MDIPSGLTPARHEEGFVISAQGDRLLLAGNDAGPYHGTEYAVSEMLERLGVRWFMPGEFGEMVPTRHDTRSPIWRSAKSLISPTELGSTHHARNGGAGARWKIHNKMDPNAMFAMPGDGSSREFVADKSRAAKESDLFAKNADGTVNPYLPNLTQPRGGKIAADKMNEIFRKNPEAGSIGIAPDDGLRVIFLPRRFAQGAGFVDLLGREGVDKELSVSEEWIQFVNAVARQVGPEFPDRIITTNGYANRNLPPEGVAIDPGSASCSPPSGATRSMHTMTPRAGRWCGRGRCFGDGAGCRIRCGSTDTTIPISPRP